MNGLSKKSPRYLLLLIVASVHCVAVFAPMGYYAVRSLFAKKKDIPFRVKLGGFTPSHAQETGMPERTRPTGNPAQKVPPKTKPQPKPQPKPKSKPKVKPKAKPKTKAKPKAKAKPKVKPKTKAKPKVKPKAKAKPRAKAKPKAKMAPEVYHDSSWDDFDPSAASQTSRTAGGGRNFNKNVPIGNRDRGQLKGAADFRTPAGGATPDEEAYWSSLQGFLVEKWDRPPGILVSDETAVQIELDVDANGWVLSKKITRLSANMAVNESVKRMLSNLNRIPKPPRGRVKFAIKLVSE